MATEETLIKGLLSLRDLFNEFAEISDTEESKSAFLSAFNQCNIIISNVNSNDISAAKNAWQALMYFTNDSIGAYSEKFLTKYQPLRQIVINEGLQ